MGEGKKRFWQVTLAVLMVLCCTAMLISQRALLSRKQEQLQRITDEAAFVSQELRDLEEELAAAGTPEGVEAIARDQLGLVRPDEVLFVESEQ